MQRQWTGIEIAPWRPRIHPVVKRLIFITCVCWILQVIVDRLTGGMATHLLGLSFAGVRSGAVWQLLTYMFLHGSFFHLFLNMLALFFLASEVAKHTGYRHFLALYFISGFLGGLAWVLTNRYAHSVCVGASGGVVGVVAAFTTLYPQRRLAFILFPFVTFPAWMAGLFIVGLELLLMLFKPHSPLAHAAHLAGGLGGFIYTLFVFRPDLVRRWRAGFGRPLQRRASFSPGELDRILDKISREGMGSLTRREREFINRAARR